MGYIFRNKTPYKKSNGSIFFHLAALAADKKLPSFMDESDLGCSIETVYADAIKEINQEVDPHKIESIRSFVAYLSGILVREIDHSDKNMLLRIDLSKKEFQNNESEKMYLKCLLMAKKTSEIVLSHFKF